MLWLLPLSYLLDGLTLALLHRHPRWPLGWLLAATALLRWPLLVYVLHRPWAYDGWASALGNGLFNLLLFVLALAPLLLLAWFNREKSL